MIAVQFTGVDLLMVVAILLILVVLIFLAVAETALNRISKVKAQALAESLDTKSAHALERLVTHPERFINPVLVTVTFLQTGQAYLTAGKALDRLALHIDDLAPEDDLSPGHSPSSRGWVLVVPPGMAYRIPNRSHQA